MRTRKKIYDRKQTMMKKKMNSEIKYVMSCIFSLSFMHLESKALNHWNEETAHVPLQHDSLQSINVVFVHRIDDREKELMFHIHLRFPYIISSMCGTSELFGCNIKTRRKIKTSKRTESIDLFK